NPAETTLRHLYSKGTLGHFVEGVGAVNSCVVRGGLDFLPRYLLFSRGDKPRPIRGPCGGRLDSGKLGSDSGSGIQFRLLPSAIYNRRSLVKFSGSLRRSPYLGLDWGSAPGRSGSAGKRALPNPEPRGWPR